MRYSLMEPAAAWLAMRNRIGRAKAPARAGTRHADGNFHATSFPERSYFYGVFIRCFLGSCGLVS